MGRNTVHGRGNILDFNTNVDIEVADGYEGYVKNVPAPKSEWKVGKETLNIRWFNIFGIRKIGGEEVDEITYDVIMQKPQLPNGTRLRVFYYKKSTDEVIEVKVFNNVDADHVKFTLDIGDPPTGVYP